MRLRGLERLSAERDVNPDALLIEPVLWGVLFRVLVLTRRARDFLELLEETQRELELLDRVEDLLQTTGAFGAFAAAGSSLALLRALQRPVQRAVRVLLEDIREVKTQAVIPRRDVKRASQERLALLQRRGFVRVPSLVQRYSVVEVVEELRLRLLVVLRRGDVVPFRHLHVPLVDPDVRGRHQARVRGALRALPGRRRDPLGDHLERRLRFVDAPFLREEDAQPVRGVHVAAVFLQRFRVQRRRVVQVRLLRLADFRVPALVVHAALKLHGLVIRRVREREHRVLVVLVRRRVRVFTRGRGQRRLRRRELLREVPERLKLRLRLGPSALFHEHVTDGRHRVRVVRLGLQRLARELLRGGEIFPLRRHRGFAE
mmetsp:Transcript_6999/g.25752  ORF Transcript_6999/g.25752 Transcript_6999/m.25752 type:complete len:373 (+) Transcript_6999:924-2042(+)